MWQIMKFHFLSLLRNRMLLFWSLLFPILLSTVMAVTILDAYSKDKAFTDIHIAVVQSDKLEKEGSFQTVLKEISQGEDALFAVQYVEEDVAKQVLSNDEVIGYITLEDEFQIMVKEKGIKQTVLQTFMDEYIQKSAIVQDLMIQGVNNQDLQGVFAETMSYLESSSTQEGDVGNVYIYSILALAMLFGGYWSMLAMHNQRADHGGVGQRNSLAPISKQRMLWIDFIVTVCIQVIITIVLLTYMLFVLGIDFGESLYAILLLLCVGTMAGNSLGVVICMYGPKDYDSGVNILTGFTLLCSVLSGMVMVELKYLIQTNIPWLAIINPGNMITDAFYAQAIYGMETRYFMNIASLLIFTFVCYGCAFLRLRRKQYASL